MCFFDFLSSWTSFDSLEPFFFYVFYAFVFPPVATVLRLLGRLLLGLGTSSYPKRCRHRSTLSI